MILLTFRVTPEPDGHTGERISTGQFTFLTRLQNLARVVPNLHLHPQPLTLDFATPYGQCRIPKNKAGHDIGTP